MRESKWMEAGSEGWRAPVAFPGAHDRAGIPLEDAESDWDEIQFVGLIERDGFLRTETLEPDWE